MYYLFDSQGDLFLVEETNKKDAIYTAQGIEGDAVLIKEYKNLKESDMELGYELDVY